MRLPSNGEMLHAVRLQPAGRPLARVAIFHGYGEHGGRYVRLMDWLKVRGVTSATLDFRGQGRSSGRRAFVRSWDNFLEDAEAFLDWEAREAPADVPRFVFGHSHGALVLIAGMIRRRIAARGFILSSPFLRPAFTVPASKRLLGAIVGWAVPWMRVKSGLKSEWLCSDKAMLDEGVTDKLMVHDATPRWFYSMTVVQAEVRERAAEFTAPFLCLTGSADGVADPATAAEFVVRAGSVDKTLRVYEGLRHELLREPTREAIFADIYRWIADRVSA